jgi:hypothetical protein
MSATRESRYTPLHEEASSENHEADGAPLLGPPRRKGWVRRAGALDAPD